MRIGQGYDVHRLVPGRRLVLGGVEIPSEKGLLGHSDADVLVHAVMDALLGAAALGDIGILFPDSDPAFRDADSVGLLRKVTTLLYRKKYGIFNIDSTIIAQAPRLSSYLPQMRERIAGACEIPADRVSVKATTEEHLGFTGAGEGIAAQAICMIGTLSEWEHEKVK
jgi:2-C-methyl-D-erythritol 2,4-cyclodiphosphate synthase